MALFFPCPLRVRYASVTLLVRKVPVPLFFPCLVVCFFNAQYYAQRVIGNYYIRKAQDYQKRGIDRVDLHAS